MSVLAEVMQSMRFTEQQNKLILESKLSNGQLAERFGRCRRQIQRQRALLKRIAKENDHDD